MANKIKVLYEPQIFNIQEYGGASRYFFEIISYFNKDPDIEFSLPLKFSNNYYLKNASFIKTRNLTRPFKTPGKNKFVKYTLRPLKNFSKKIRSLQQNKNRIILHEALKKKDFNIFHPTYYNTEFLKYFMNKPIVITVYDMIYEQFPEHYPNDPYPAYKKELIKKANKIIAISNNTKKDLIKFHKVKEEKIEVIHLACSFEEHKITKDKKKLLPDQYILFTGERKRYKNFAFFIKSIAPLLEKYKNLNIICAGSKPFKKKEKALFGKLNLTKRIYHHSASDDFLIEMYKKAIIFVFPSLYEGFGIPILEAFSAGCPVACSNTSSFPEVAGDAAVFFDPYSEDSISTSIDNLISSKELRDEISIKGYERLKLFSWEKTAKFTKKLYSSIV